jgi:hypothetical protein
LLALETSTLYCEENFCQRGVLARHGVSSWKIKKDLEVAHTNCHAQGCCGIFNTPCVRDNREK